MSTNTYTIATTGTSIALNPSEGSRPAATPSGLIVTRAVETKAGWVGQIIVDKEILWQGEPTRHAMDAQEEANYRVVQRIKKLFRR